MTRYLFILLISLLSFSCKEEKEIFETEAVADYMPLQVGKSITYRLDSTVFTKSGTVIETHKYQVKHTVLGITNDNTGHEAYIVQRTINNETASDSWVNNGTFIITHYDNKIEVNDNNLRIVVLQAPFKEGFSWGGNSQLPSEPYQELYKELEAGKDMNNWQFSYNSFTDQETYQGQQYSNVWTITQRNETLNIPPSTGTSYGYKEESTEKYAKGIGLVYKNFQLYDFQSPSADNPSSHYTGFGITMWMIEHN